MPTAGAIPPTVAHSLSEAAFQQQVLDLAALYGWKAMHMHDSRRQVRPGVHVGDRDTAGWPDVILARPPRLIACELKAEKGRLTDAQREWLTTLEMCGVEAYVWKPSNWPTIEQVLSINQHMEVTA